LINLAGKDLMMDNKAKADP